MILEPISRNRHFASISLTYSGPSPRRVSLWSLQLHSSRVMPLLSLGSWSLHSLSINWKLVQPVFLLFPLWSPWLIIVSFSVTLNIYHSWWVPYIVPYPTLNFSTRIPCLLLSWENWSLSYQLISPSFQHLTIHSLFFLLPQRICILDTTFSLLLLTL